MTLEMENNFYQDRKLVVRTFLSSITNFPAIFFDLACHEVDCLVLIHYLKSLINFLRQK